MKNTKRNIKTPNKIVLKDNYAELIIYNNKSFEVARALIDSSDVELVSKHKWSFSNGYVISKIDGKFTSIHRLIMEEELKGKNKMDIDHKNGIRIDNRRSNLRICTRSQNNQNRKGALGICFNKNNKKWVSYVRVNYELKYLGYYEDRNDALSARRAGELLYFGEFAK